MACKIKSEIVNFFQKLNTTKTIWVGFSGGLDSTVLLHLCSQINLPIKAIHVHHNLSTYADAWGLHCETICKKLNIELIVKKIQAKHAKGESPEEIARQKRYAIFLEMIGEDETLLTAHHQNDQVETFLLQLVRGAGPKGLSGMPGIKLLGKGFHARPLLNFSREKLAEYAQENRLHWIEDESNENKNFSRNFLRHEVMPLLKSRWPAMQTSIVRSAEHCREQQVLLESYIEKDLEWCASFGTVMLAEASTGQGQNISLSVTKLLRLDSIRLPAVLRVWIEKNNFKLPSTIKLQHIIKNILHARSDKNPVIHFGECEIRRYKDDLFIMKKLFRPLSQEYTWDFKQPLQLDSFRLSASLTNGAGLSSTLKQVTVRFRQGGEKIKLSGRTHHSDLKKLFQSWRVPMWKRNSIPLIFVENELVAVVGYCVAGKFLAKEISWQLSIE